VDDASTDRTGDAVKKQFPQVNIITGDGNLFWSRGMYTAWSAALNKDGYDYYLWLNDDVEVFPFFFEELLECSAAKNNNCIVSGLIEDKDTHKIIYGGTDNKKKLLQANGNIQNITRMNGNIVLVPQRVVDTIGILDPVLHHDLGDIDYGLRAIEAKINVFSTRKVIGKSYSNNYCRARKWSTTITDRFRKLYSPLGSPPNLNFYFRRKHFGIINALVYWAFLHFINFLPDKIVTLFWGDYYHDK
jgi:glycosyltransferase involved in cell wall biosynthesis